MIIHFKTSITGSGPMNQNVDCDIPYVLTRYYINNIAIQLFT